MNYFCRFEKNIPEKNKKGIAALNLIVIFGLVAMLAVFLFENDNLVSQNYQFRDYEKQLKERQALIKKLEIKQAEQGSLSNLAEAAKNFNLVTIDKVKYLPAAQASVALLKFNQ
jgi:hypothetical protein